MAWIIEDRRTRMPAHFVEEALERHTVMEVLARMQLESTVDTRIVESIEQRPPASSQLGKGFFCQPSRSLRPWIYIGPGQCARKSRVRGKAQAAARVRGKAQLSFGPGRLNSSTPTKPGQSSDLVCSRQDNLAQATTTQLLGPAPRAIYREPASQNCGPPPTAQGTFLNTAS